MRKLTTAGLICLEDDYRFVYKIAKIKYEEWEDGNFRYTFSPYYNVIDILPDRLFQGIPGLDLSLRKKVYVRSNIVPTFIAERTPSERREDVRTLLEKNGMTSLNRLEWLIHTETRYSGDRLFVRPFDGNDSVEYYRQSMYDLVIKSDDVCRKLLQIICFGDYLYADDVTIDDESRPYYYRILMSMYIHEYERKRAYRNLGIEKAKEMNVYKGRPRIITDSLLFDKIATDYLSGKISWQSACNMLGISRATFYRRLRNRLSDET